MSILVWILVAVCLVIPILAGIVFAFIVGFADVIRGDAWHLPQPRNRMRKGGP